MLTEQEMLDESFDLQMDWMHDNPDLTKAEREAILAEWGFIKITPQQHERMQEEMDAYHAWRQVNREINDEQEAYEFWCLLNELH